MTQIKDLPQNTFAKVYHFDKEKLECFREEYLSQFNIPNNTKYFSVCYIHDDNSGDVLSVGYSLCRSTDTPRRKLGFQIAWNRAVDNFKSDRA